MQPATGAQPTTEPDAPQWPSRESAGSSFQDADNTDNTESTESTETTETTESQGSPVAARPTRPPRDERRTAERAAGLVIGGFTLLLFLRLRPDLLFSRATPTGGDNAAHVWTADYARRELLPHLRLTGWSNDWFSGLPVLGFYFPGPTWLIVALSFVLPYAIAYKLVTVLGILTLPWLCRRLGRTAGLDTTASLLLGLAAFPFLFARHFRILGGNILSTMAGEFSFSISLSLVVLYAALLIVMLRTGRGRGRTALVLALAGLSHIVPTLLALLFTLAAFVSYAERDRIRRQAADVLRVGAVGAALAGFWLLPFGANLAFTNSMDYEKNRKFLKTLFPFFPHSATLHTPSDGAAAACVALVLAAIAIVYGLVARDKFIRALSITMGLAGAAFCVSPQSAMWNNRLLPLWFFCAYLLGGQGLLVLARAITRAAARRSRSTKRASVTRPAFLATAVGLIVTAPAFGLAPGALPVPVITKSGLGFDPLSTTREFRQAQMPFGWAASNESGAEDKPGWKEYRRLVDALATLPPGRAFWEHDSYARFGSAMALMALPYWTRSRVQSSEGLYFEASATTPFHFLTVPMVSKTSANPQRRLPYGAFDLAKGIDRMRRLGIRYYVAVSPTALAAARASTELRRVVTSSPFEVYEIVGQAIVQPLTTEPVVATGIRGSLDGGFIDLGIAAWTDPSRFPETVALDGPSAWQRAQVHVEHGSTIKGKAPVRGANVTISATAPRPLTPAIATNVQVANDHVTFDVDQIGKPVLVRISAFPNWNVSGATGPYRVNPNFMVVVPTRRHVRLHYGYTRADLAGWLFTATGIAGGLVLWRRDRAGRDRLSRNGSTEGAFGLDGSGPDGSRRDGSADALLPA